MIAKDRRPGRFTSPNPGVGGRGTYRIWMDRAGDFELKAQCGGMFAFGDLVNRLGELEDMAEKLQNPKLQFALQQAGIDLKK